MRIYAGLALAILLLGRSAGTEPPNSLSGTASWYGDERRGHLMANGKPFNPDALTAASWCYPLGSRVRVSAGEAFPPKLVEVTITDRGPARELVKAGRIIDLSLAAFRELAPPAKGIIAVRIEPLSGSD